MIDPQTPEGRGLSDLKPDFPDMQPGAQVFLHGDVVADNIIDTPQGLCLIDWQCPAAGDAAEDLAIFLSPAMQYIYGKRSLSEADEMAFLDAYGDANVTRRYRRLALSFCWRMAAYCLWKKQRGDTDYAVGFQREVARLEALR